MPVEQQAERDAYLDEMTDGGWSRNLKEEMRYETFKTQAEIAAEQTAISEESTLEDQSAQSALEDV